MTALNSWCNEQQMSSVQQVPVYGQSVCVRHTDTDQWRRAQVTRLSDRYVESPVVLLQHSLLLVYKISVKQVATSGYKKNI